MKRAAADNKKKKRRGQMYDFYENDKDDTGVEAVARLNASNRRVAPSPIPSSSQGEIMSELRNLAALDEEEEA